MVLTVYDRDSLAKAQAEVRKLEEKKQKEKERILKKVKGKIHFPDNYTPMEIQEQIRDGWFE